MIRAEGTAERCEAAVGPQAALSSAAIRRADLRYNVPDMPEKITLTPEAVAALRGGNKIEAIRLMREKSGIGLAEAKAVVEAFERVSAIPAGAKVVMKQAIHVKRGAPVHIDSPPAGLSPGEVPRAAGSWKVAVAIVIAIIVAFLWAKLR